MPYTVALVVAGLLVGIGASAVGYPAVEVSPEIVLLVLLPGLVFEAAYRLRIRELRRWSGDLTLLAVPGVLVSAAVVAVVLNVGTGLRLDLAFIVGAMVSATDPAAVVATFKRLQVPEALSTMVDGESLLNDGTGLVLFALAISAVEAPIGPGEAVVTFAGTIGISAQEADRFRLYLVKGGFLWVDDFWGTRAWDQWSEEIRKVLPEFPIPDLWVKATIPERRVNAAAVQALLQQLKRALAPTL